MIEGIMHGPYLGLSHEEVRSYIQDQVGIEVSDSLVEIFHDDVQSNHQYEQHCDAVKSAMNEGRIAKTEGLGYFVMSIVLKPWSGDIRALVYNYQA